MVRHHLGPEYGLHGQVELMPGKINRPPALPKDTALAPAIPAVTGANDHEEGRAPASTPAAGPSNHDAVSAGLPEVSTERREASLEAVIGMLHRLDQHVMDLVDTLRGGLADGPKRANNVLNGSTFGSIELGTSILRRKDKPAGKGEEKQIATSSSGRQGKRFGQISAGREGSGSGLSGDRDINYLFFSKESFTDMEDSGLE